MATLHCAAGCSWGCGPRGASAAHKASRDFAGSWPQAHPHLLRAKRQLYEAHATRPRRCAPACRARGPPPPRAKRPVAARLVAEAPPQPIMLQPPCPAASPPHDTPGPSATPSATVAEIADARQEETAGGSARPDEREKLSAWLARVRTSSPTSSDGARAGDSPSRRAYELVALKRAHADEVARLRREHEAREKRSAELLALSRAHAERLAAAVEHAVAPRARLAHAVSTGDLGVISAACGARVAAAAVRADPASISVPARPETPPETPPEHPPPADAAVVDADAPPTPPDISPNSPTPECVMGMDVELALWRGMLLKCRAQAALDRKATARHRRAFTSPYTRTPGPIRPQMTFFGTLPLNSHVELPKQFRQILRRTSAKPRAQRPRRLASRARPKPLPYGAGAADDRVARDGGLRMSRHARGHRSQ